MYIELKDAVKKYGEKDNCVYALNKVSCGIKQGEICVILGPSGSGKSTLLNMLGGLDALDSGEILVDGQRVESLKAKDLTEYRRKDIGFIFQFYNLIQDLTVAENIEVVSDVATKPLDIDEILEALDISALKHRFPKELSGGQQQRVAIARALIKNPKILLCDELTGALDSKSSQEVLKYIEKVNEKFGTTIVIITHNAEIKNMAHRIICLKDGKIVTNSINGNRVEAGALVL